MSKKDEVCRANPEYCKAEFLEIKETLKEIHCRLFIGNGKPAFETRIDRLEQNEKSRSKLIWLIIGVVVVITINAGWELIQKVSSIQQPQHVKANP